MKRAAIPREFASSRQRTPSRSSVHNLSCHVESVQPVIHPLPRRSSNQSGHVLAGSFIALPALLSRSQMYSLNKSLGVISKVEFLGLKYL